MTTTAERPAKPQEERIPVNVEAWTYFKKIIGESPDGFVAATTSGKQFVVSTNWFRQTGGREIAPDAEWWDSHQCWIGVRICDPSANPRDIALREEPDKDIEAIVALRPFIEDFGTPMQVYGRGKQTIDLPVLGTIEGNQNPHYETRDCPWARAGMYVNDPAEAERIGNALMQLVKFARGET